MSKTAERMEDRVGLVAPILGRQEKEWKKFRKELEYSLKTGKLTESAQKQAVRGLLTGRPARTLAKKIDDEMKTGENSSVSRLLDEYEKLVSSWWELKFIQQHTDELLVSYYMRLVGLWKQFYDPKEGESLGIFRFLHGLKDKQLSAHARGNRFRSLEDAFCWVEAQENRPAERKKCQDCK